jgi:hypothetical protein
MSGGGSCSPLAHHCRHHQQISRRGPHELIFCDATEEPTVHPPPALPPASLSINARYELSILTSVKVLAVHPPLDLTPSIWTLAPMHHLAACSSTWRQHYRDRAWPQSWADVFARSSDLHNDNRLPLCICLVFFCLNNFRFYQSNGVQNVQRLEVIYSDPSVFFHPEVQWVCYYYGLLAIFICSFSQ